MDYLLNGMNFETYVMYLQYFCYCFIAIFACLLTMILTRQPGTINLST